MAKYVVSQFIESFNWMLKLLNHKNLYKLKYFLSIKVLSIVLYPLLLDKKIKVKISYS